MLFTISQLGNRAPPTIFSWLFHSVPGILLCHIGYENEGGMITWKNLDIETLHCNMVLPVVTFAKNSKKERRARTPPSPTDHLKGCYKTLVPTDTVTNGDDTDGQNGNDNNNNNKNCNNNNNNNTHSLLHHNINTLSIPPIPYNQFDPRIHDMTMTTTTTTTTNTTTGQKTQQSTPVTSPSDDVTRTDEVTGPWERGGDGGGGARCLTPLLILRSGEKVEEEGVKISRERCESLSEPFDGPLRKMLRVGSMGESDPFFIENNINDDEDDDDSNNNINNNNNKNNNNINRINNNNNNNNNNNINRINRNSFYCSDIENIPTNTKVENTNTTVTAIKLLDLSYNKIKDLSPILRYPDLHITHFLNHLEKLDLSFNRLEEIPGCICKSLTRLTTLNLNDNLLQKFPFELLVHQKLESLNLSGNKLTDDDMIDVDENSMIRATCSLEKLDLSRNNFHNFPLWISDSFPCLVSLFLSSNKIRWVI